MNFIWSVVRAVQMADASFQANVTHYLQSSPILSLVSRDSETAVAQHPLSSERSRGRASPASHELWASQQRALFLQWSCLDRIILVIQQQ